MKIFIRKELCLFTGYLQVWIEYPGTNGAMMPEISRCIQLLAHFEVHGLSVGLRGLELLFTHRLPYSSFLGHRLLNIHHKKEP